MPNSSYTDQLRLDSDSRWWSITVAAERLMARLRSTTHTLRDLEEALAQGRLRCMVRSVDDPWKDEPEQRMQLARAMWVNKIKLEWDREYGVLVMRRDGGGHFRGWSFYIWSVDFEALWPADPSFPVPIAPAPGRREGWLERVSRMSDEAMKDYSPPPWPSVVSEPPKSPKPEPPSPTPIEQAQARLREMKSMTGVDKRWIDFKKITGLQYREFRQAVKDERDHRRRRKNPPAKS